MVASDAGPGIEDVERAMQDGYTTGNGLGLGLPGTRRLVDDFELDTAPGVGTHDPARQVDPCLIATTPPGPPSSSSGSPSGRSRARRARATAPCSPTFAGGALVAAIDGLGHGDEAADAAAIAADVLAAHAATTSPRT